MIEIINQIVKENNIHDFGICEFNKKYLINCRAINRIPSNAKSTIVFLFPYKNNVVKGNLSRYSFAKDYHIFGMNILNKISNSLTEKFPEYTFSAFTDNSPIPEVMAAIEAGLGVRGDNGLLITPKYGSWVFIGEIVTDMDLSKYTKVIKNRECIHCKKCENNCPGKAIHNGKINKETCASHITQKKGILNESEKEIIKKAGYIWGCDICQEVCPMNKNKENTYIPFFTEDIITNIECNQYDALKDRAFQWRPKEVIERNIKILSE